MSDPTIKRIQEELKSQLESRAKAVADEMLGMLNSGAGLKAAQEFIQLQKGMKASGLQSMQPPMQSTIQLNKQAQEKKVAEKKRQEAIFSPLNPGFLHAVAMYLQKVLLGQQQQMQEAASREPHRKRPIGDPEEEAAEALENEKSHEFREPDSKSEFLITLEKLTEEKAMQQSVLEANEELDPLKQKFGNALGENAAFEEKPSQVLQDTIDGTIAKEIEGSVKQQFAAQEKEVTEVIKTYSVEIKPETETAVRSAHKAPTPFDSMRNGPSPFDGN